MFFFTTVALLVFLAVPDGNSLGNQGQNLRCQCIKKETKPIRWHSMEVTPASSHCNEKEIIATLKKDGQKICLDPNALWVKRVLRKKLHGLTLKNNGQGKIFIYNEA